MEEQQFIQALLRKDNQAVARLVDLYQQKIFNTILGLVQNWEDAEDVCQETFIEILDSIGQFQGKSSLSTWIYRISITQSLDFLRYKKRKKRFAFIKSIFGLGGELVVDVPDFVHPSVQLEQKEQATILFKAIQQLPENQKVAFTLHKIENLSHQEIAEILNTTVSSTESLLYRAKQNLRKLLSNLQND